MAKLAIVIKEAEETVFWLELLADAGIVAKARMQGLLAEANELVAIFVASRKTATGKGSAIAGSPTTQQRDRSIAQSPDHSIA